jgi:hypothetical protein
MNAIGRPCPICGHWFYGTATQPAACDCCVAIGRFLRSKREPRDDPGQDTP